MTSSISLRACAMFQGNVKTRTSGTEPITCRTHSNCYRYICTHACVYICTYVDVYFFVRPKLLKVNSWIDSLYLGYLYWYSDLEQGEK